MDSQAEEAAYGSCLLDNYHMNHPGPGPRTNQARVLKAEARKQRTSRNAGYTAASGSNNRYEQTDIAVPQLNFLGLPIRLGEKECSYYKQKGYCGYGARCVFHHPDRTLMGSYNPDPSSFKDDGINIKSSYSFGNYINSESSFAPWAWGASKPYQGGRRRHRYSSYQNEIESSSYSYHQHVNTNLLPLKTKSWPPSDWIGYHYHYHYQAPKANGADTILDQNQLLSVKAEELPPVCAYLLKTGDCKFKSACRYHHPSNWVYRREECVLSDNGLPLKPGKEVCPHYGNFGLCISGPACMFDHPAALNTTDKGKASG